MWVSFGVVENDSFCVVEGDCLWVVEGDGLWVMEGDGEVGGTLGKSIVLRSSSPFELLTVE